MDGLILDTENSGAQRNKGHPFDPRNKMCLVGLGSKNSGYVGYRVEHGPAPYGESLAAIQKRVSTTDLLVGCNLKYDIHWIKRYGIRLPPGIKIWDCQLAHFLITAQQQDYPSMDDIALRYGLPIKPDKMKEYWAAGIDTDQIPFEELLDYNQNHDLVVTEQIYQRQVEEIEALGLGPLFRLSCSDLLVLEEMEFNGMKYNVELSLAKAKELRGEEEGILERLWDVIGDRGINWGSGDQLSTILYGGDLTFKERIPVGTYNSGSKAGQPRYSVVRRTVRFDRLVEPLRGSELKKQGFFKTDEPTLLQLKAKGKAKRIIELVLELSRIQKLVGTYYEGIPKKFDKFGWEEGIIHHSLNQCVAVTGRLSCSNPNLQNNEKNTKECFITRWEESKH